MRSHTDADGVHPPYGAWSPESTALHAAASANSCDISIVIPAWNEEGNLRVLYPRLVAALEPLQASWEVVFVDDGSRDRTWQEIVTLHATDSRVGGLRLSRNFGHQHALFAGMAAAAGKAVISMDADLQHPPEVVPQLVEEWRRGSMIVHTVRIDAPDTTLFKRATSRLFYLMYSLLSGVRIDPGMADFRLLDRQVVNELMQFHERGLFLRGLVQWIGYPSSKVAFQCGTRWSGSSKYSLRRMLRFAWDGIKSFSVMPLRIATVTGVLTGALAFLTILYAVGTKLMGLPTIPGWASILSILGFLFGILFVLLGVIGEYIAEILKEVRSRPRYLVRELVGGPVIANQHSHAAPATVQVAAVRVAVPVGSRATADTEAVG